MEFNCEQMFLLAKIEVLEKENDALKEERVTTLQKLELAEISVSLLKAEIGVVKDAKQTEMFEHQIEMAKMIRKLDKARKDGEAKIASIENLTKAKIAKIESDFDAKHQNEKIVHERKLQETINDASAQMVAFKKQKDEEVNEWKKKYDEVNKIVVDHDTNVNRMYPMLTDDQTSKLIALLILNQHKIGLVRLRTDGDQEIAKFVFKSNFSMASSLGLDKFDVTLFQNQHRIRPLEPKAEPNTK